eukprot:SAG11_NODE_2255_length_3620_cov_1.538483_8_plen_75_part_01
MSMPPSHLYTEVLFCLTSFIRLRTGPHQLVRGYMLALTITDKDLQKFVLTEKRATRRAAISGVSGEDAAQAAMAA